MVGRHFEVEVVLMLSTAEGQICHLLTVTSTGNPYTIPPSIFWPFFSNMGRLPWLNLHLIDYGLQKYVCSDLSGLVCVRDLQDSDRDEISKYRVESETSNIAIIMFCRKRSPKQFQHRSYQTMTKNAPFFNSLSRRSEDKPAPESIVNRALKTQKQWALHCLLFDVWPRKVGFLKVYSEEVGIWPVNFFLVAFDRLPGLLKLMIPLLSMSQYRRSIFPFPRCTWAVFGSY